MATDYFKKKHSKKHKGKSANTVHDKDVEVGYVMLGLNGPESINKWYSGYSVIVKEEAENINYSHFNMEEQQRRFDEIIELHFGQVEASGRRK
jgi:hypothetical protein